MEKHYDWQVVSAGDWVITRRALSTAVSKNTGKFEGANELFLKKYIAKSWIESIP